MKPSHLLVTVGLTFTAYFTPPTLAADAAKPGILRQMSDTLAAARQFSVHARREGSAPADSVDLTLTVSRPNKLLVTSTSKADVRRFYADGQNFTIFDVTRNHYATVPMATSLDGLVDTVSAKYGFTPPLAELALSDVFADIGHKTQTTTNLGLTRCPGGFLGLSSVDCQRIGLSGRLVDAELWIGIDDKLPRKMILTFKDRPGQPKSTVTFSDWNLAARPTAQEFTFVPPKGAQRIAMHTQDQIAAARKSAKK